MQAEIDAGLFVESAFIHGNLYGQSVAAVDAVSATGRICILEIDVQGAVSVQKTKLQPYYTFILPPTTDDLRERLQRRGSESSETLERRLVTAGKEIEFHTQNIDMFDATLINNDLEECYQQFLDTIAQLYPHFAEIRRSNSGSSSSNSLASR